MNLLERTFEQYWDTQLQGLISERQMAIDFYSNAHEEHVRKYIRIDADDIPYTWSGLTKRVVDKRSVVYKKPATRYVNDVYNEITKSKDYWMKEAERRSRLTGVIAVRPFWNGKEFKYQIIQNFLPIFGDNELHPIGIAYPLSTGSRAEQVWAYWDAENHFVTDANGSKLKDQSSWGVNEENVNPYGVLPFAFLHISPVVNDFWTPGAFDVVNTNLMTDLALTDLNYVLRYQSFKQIYTKGLQDAEAVSIKLGYNYAPNIPNETEIGILDLQPRVNETTEAIKFQIQNIERNYGLNISWGMEGSPSGFSLVVQNIDLLQGWEDDKDIAKEWERDLFEIERAIYAVETRRQLPDTFELDLAEVSFPIDKQAETSYWDWKVKNNLATYADY